MENGISKNGKVKNGSQKPSNTENARSEFSNKFLKRLNLIDKQGDIKKPTRKLVLKKIKNALPILGWAVPYDWRGNLAGDVIAGVTLAVMQVLSGMADALLADVPVILGIYCSIFPVIIYGIFGSSRHISIGSNSLICMLVGTILNKHAHNFAEFFHAQNGSDFVGYAKIQDHVDDLGQHFRADISTTTSAPELQTEQDVLDDHHGDFHYPLTPVIATLTLLVGMWQVVLSICRFGQLSWLFSDVAMSGYTAGAGIHLFTSQIKSLLGVKMPRRIGPLVVLRTYVDLFSPSERGDYDGPRIGLTNTTTLIISLISIGFLVVNEEVIKPRIAKKCSIPVPMQVVVVIIGTGLSFGLGFNENYKVDVVGEIPQGLPEPAFPVLNLFTELVLDSLIIAVVAYGFSLSMAKLIAKKFSYSIDGNQELLGEGFCNVFGAFFRCLPSSASMSRSLAVAASGGKTQLTGFLSSILLIFVLLFIGPLFEQLPKAILAAVIVVALKGVLLQIPDFWKYWKNSKLDGFLWMVTFIGVILTTVDMGLIICLAMTVFVMTYRNYQINIMEVEQGAFEDNEIDDDKDSDEEEEKQQNDVEKAEENVLVLKIIGVLSFANYEKVLKQLNKRLKLQRQKTNTMDGQAPVVIVDLTSVPYLDQSAAKAFIDWMVSVQDLCFPSIVAPEGEVRDMMEKHQFDEYQMHETLTEANDNFMMKRSKDSGLSTVNEEDDDLQTNPSGGGNIPQMRINFGSISSQGSNNDSMTSDDIEFQKREEERIKEMYKVLNIERRKSIARNKSDGLDIAKDYVRRASMAQGLTTPKSRSGSQANSRRGSILPGAILSPNDVGRRSGRLGIEKPNGQRRPSTIFMAPKTFRERQPSVF